MKKCPYCAEEIQDEAIKCRFCNSELKKKKWWKGCLIGCLVTIVLMVLLSYLFLYLSYLLLKLILYKVFYMPRPPLPKSYYYPPFSGPALPGLESMFHDFNQFFHALWLRLIEFLNSYRGMQNV